MNRSTLALLPLALALGCGADSSSGATATTPDGRRTAQFAAIGPRSATADRLRSIRIPDGTALNAPVTIADDGTIYAGTWGVLRSLGSADRRDWDKLDGKVYAFRPDLSPAWSAPFAAPRLPYCYDHAGRSDPDYCPTGGAVSWLNGTVEGRATIRDGVLYAGRGDGALYALDAATGAARWRFATYDPTDREDPDGGGEVLAEPWIDANGTIYAASFGVGPHETNAIYAIGSDGLERWRYPSRDASATSSFFAALATSPDGKRLYAAGFWLHGGSEPSPLPPSFAPEDGARYDRPSQLLAFDIDRPGGTGDDRLAWSVDLRNADGFPFGATSLAVGSDGTLFVGGSTASVGYHATMLAFRDGGSAAEAAWPASVSIDAGRTAYALGVALREEAGRTEEVYVTTGNLNNAAGGKLYVLSPADGAIEWELDPERAGVSGSMNGIALDRLGTAYVTTHGAGDDGGQLLAVTGDRTVLFTLPLDQPVDLARPILDDDGDLYVGGSLRDNPCPVLVPVELGLCPNVPRDPALYVLEALTGD